MVRPDHFLEFAKRLLDDPNCSESDLRVAAHAAYYSVYHLMAEYFGLNTEKREAKHGTIISKLEIIDFSSSPGYVQKARAVYRTLIDIREQADYHITKPFDGADAEDALEKARGVFARIL